MRAQVIARLGKEIENPDSVYYWAQRNGIPVYCPALTDGSIGDMLYFFTYRSSPSLNIDIVADIRCMTEWKKGWRTSARGAVSCSGWRPNISTELGNPHASYAGPLTTRRSKRRRGQGSSSSAVVSPHCIVSLIVFTTHRSSVGNCYRVLVCPAGVPKHHILNANLFRNGADYAVFVNTAQEFDGSDSGAMQCAACRTR